MKFSPSCLMAIVSLLVISSSWLLGGRASCAPYVMIGISFLSIVPLAFYLLQKRPPLKMAILFLSPWIGLITWISISIWNAKYTPIQTSQKKEYLWKLQGSFKRVDNFPFLPDTIDVYRTSIFLALLIGMMLVAVSIYYCINRRSQIRYLLNVICLNGFVLSIVGIYFKLTGAKEILGQIPWVTNSFFSTYRYHNHWGAYIILCFFCSLALFSWHWQKNGKQISNRGNKAPLYLMMSLIFLLTLPLSTSRAGILSIFIIFLILTARYIFVASKKGNLSTIPKLLSIAILCIGSFSLIYLVSKNFFWREVLKTDQQIEMAIKGETFDLRIPLMRDSLNLVEKRPFRGWGYYSFGYVFPKVAGDEFHKLNEGRGFKIECTHNDWLQHLIELGIIGFSMFLAVPCFLLLLIRKFGRNNKVSFFLFSSCLCILIFALYDFPLSNPSVFAHFFILFTLAAKYSLISAQKIDTPLIDVEKQ